MKNKLKLISVFIILGLFFVLNGNVNAALSSNDLISVGSGKYAITVSTNTTVDNIIKVLGTPKVETISVFGGNAYTFYTDSDYNNFLYIETTADGKIISFGSVDSTYQTRTYSYGSDYNYRDYGYLRGCFYNDSGTIKGGIYYNKSIVKNSIFTDYRTTYMSNPTDYLKALSKHAVAMYNAISIRLGNKTNLIFDEDAFYINEQFKEFGTSIREYLYDMKKTNYMSALGVKEKIDLVTNSMYTLNPLTFASLADRNRTTNFGSRNIAVMDYNPDAKIISGVVIGQDTFDRLGSVDLTDTEKSKLAAGRLEYQNAIKKLYEENGLYKIEPVSTIASSLVAGELKQSKKEGILNYINAIRVAGGLPKLKLNETSFKVAQHISTLISYRYTELGLPIAHIPAQPEGVSDEYYNIAVGDRKGYAENLGQSLSSSNEKMMMQHINLFLDESSETPQVFSHRAKVLDPEYTEFGYGISPYTFSNEFSGYKESDVILEAWPSEGVTFLESLAKEDKRFKWSARFLDKYKVTDNTNVKVKCLNTGKEWNFNTEGEVGNSFFSRYIKSISSINNKVVFYNTEIIPEAGYVYQITVSNLLNSINNKTESYTYRSVFEYADTDNSPSADGKLRIEIDPENMFKVEGKENVYRIPIGKEIKLKATEEVAVTDNKVTWISSSEGVSVTQNGTLYATGDIDKEVTITVSYDGSNSTEQITVIPFIKIEEVGIGQIATTENPNPDQELRYSQLDKGKDIKLGILYLPENASEDVEIEWKVISKTNTNIEYSIDNPEITKYIKVDIIEDGKSQVINVKAVDAEVDNHEYIVKAYAKGVSGTYTGTYNIDVYVKLESVIIELSGKGIYKDDKMGISTFNINYNEFAKAYNDSDKINFRVSYEPQNATVRREVTWSTNSSNVIKNYDQNGQYQIIKAGSTTITATNPETGISTSAEVNINVNLEKVTIYHTDTNIVLDGTSIGINAKTEQFTYSIYPSIAEDDISFDTSNYSVAFIENPTDYEIKNKIRRIVFTMDGNVELTAMSDSNPYIGTEVEYTIVTKISEIKFAKPNVSINLNEKYNNAYTVIPQGVNVDCIVKFESSNKGVAVVNKNGEVTGVGPGTTTIKAIIDKEQAHTTEDVTAEYNVSVIVPIESVKISSNFSTIMLEEGSKTLEATILPENHSGKTTIRWISDNPNVISVNSTTGVITPLQKGKATITLRVIANGKSYTYSKEIKVKSINDPKYQKGDLDRDGVVNANDAAVALKLYNYGGVTEEDLKIGDMDDDGIINANDAALILKIYNYGYDE